MAARTEYKTVDTSTLAGLKHAERLLEAGWKIVRSGLSLVYFQRRPERQVSANR